MNDSNFKLNVRRATTQDIPRLIEIDHVAREDARRVEHIKESVDAGLCWLCESEGAGGQPQVIGYGLLDYSFFDQGFISLVYIYEPNRRGGAGLAIMRRLEAECHTQKLFTSTNESNAPMRALLAKLGYEPSGVIHNLDPGDPELVYYKKL